jgi:putative cardiolipin synthase
MPVFADTISASLNTEAGLLIDSSQLVAQFDSLLDINLFQSAYSVRRDADGSIHWVEFGPNGETTTRPYEPHSSFGAAIMNMLWSIFIDEEWL